MFYKALKNKHKLLTAFDRDGRARERDFLQSGVTERPKNFGKRFGSGAHYDIGLNSGTGPKTDQFIASHLRIRSSLTPNCIVNERTQAKSER